MANLRIELPSARVHGIPVYWPAIEVKLQERHQMILFHVPITISDLLATWIGQNRLPHDHLGVWTRKMLTTNVVTLGALVSQTVRKGAERHCWSKAITTMYHTPTF